MKRKVSRKKNKSRRKRIYTKKGGNTNIILETINNSNILYSTTLVHFVEVYYRYCIDLFKSALDKNYNFNVVFRFSQAQEDEMNNSKKFGDYLNKLNTNNKTIRVDINHEHTLVKGDQQVYPHNAPNGKISYINNSTKKYKVSLYKYDELKKSDIILDYSNTNIENLKGSNIYSSYSNKLIYIPPAFFDLYVSKDSRTIDCLTTFINRDIERRKKLIENVKAENINLTNVNNVFSKNDLRQLYKNTKILINIHQTEGNHTFEELRVLPALLCGCIVVAEDSPLKELIPYSNCIIWSPYDTIVNKVKEVSDNYDKYFNDIFANQDNLNILKGLHNQNILSLQNKLNSLK